MEQEQSITREAGTCIAYAWSGDICGKPGIKVDKVRGGMVCADHDPDRHKVPTDFLTRIRHAGI